jgi:Putative metallopeptidase
MARMTSSIRLPALFLTLAWLAMPVAALAQPAPARMPGQADPEPNPNNSPIEIVYNGALDPAHRPIYERLKRRRVLEDLREFLSPLKLQNKLTVSLEDCKGVRNMWYSSSNSKVTLCYEYIAYIESIATKGNPPAGLPRDDVVVGPFLHVVLHEMAHAVFDMLDIPVLGREEDAADALSQFILLQFGPQIARRSLLGVAFFYGVKSQGQTPAGEDFSDEHGTDGQRFYNALCLAYGSDPKTFDDFIQKKLLPEDRRRRCGGEYRAVAKAFGKLLLPHVDPELLKQVQARQDWLKPEDGTDIGQGPGGPTPPGGGPRSPGGGPTQPSPAPGGNPTPGVPVPARPAPGR